jgi:hypothetical protein
LSLRENKKNKIIKLEEIMKTKKFEKKLALNKKTIADLSNGQLGQVKGGGPKPTVLGVPCPSQTELITTCPTCPQTCANTCPVTCAFSCPDTCTDGIFCVWPHIE